MLEEVYKLNMSDVMLSYVKLILGVGQCDWQTWNKMNIFSPCSVLQPLSCQFCFAYLAIGGTYLPF